VIAFTIVLVIIVGFVVTLLDLGYPPSATKALIKIIGGVSLTLGIHAVGNGGGMAIISMGIGIVMALLGTADMTAARGKQKNGNGRQA